jgi:ABC-type multidrug transport system fused ATPase/permease subunit
MFCPQCGTESSSGQQYCRSCGANLKVIGKAVSLSEAIARSDRGPLPKIKEMMKSLKIEQVSDDVSRALDQMNQEIVKNAGSLAMVKPQSFEEMIEKRRGKQREKKQKTAAQRREQHIVQGLISLFSGLGLMIFLYYLSSVLVLKLPEHIIARAPFEIDPVVRMIWLVGLMPTLTGVGRIVAGLSIRREPTPLVEFPEQPTNDLRSEISDLKTTNELPPRYEPGSVTERTTNILNRER